MSYRVDYIHHEILSYIPDGEKKQEVNRLLLRYRRNVSSELLRGIRETLDKHSKNTVVGALKKDIQRTLEGLGFNTGKAQEKQNV